MFGGIERRDDLSAVFDAVIDVQRGGGDPSEEPRWEWRGGFNCLCINQNTTCSSNAIHNCDMLLCFYYKSSS